MRFAAGMFVAVIAATTYPSSAQYPPRGLYPQQEECPQGRQLRQQKYFPPQMTDCQVLDADTAAERQRLQRKPNAAPVAQQPMRLPAPKPVLPATAVSPAAPAQAPPSSPDTYPLLTRHPHRRRPQSLLKPQHNTPCLQSQYMRTTMGGL
jgi:hypothetical protein